MTQTAEKPDFSHFKDGETGTIHPSMLDDFRFDNQRGQRTKKDFESLCSSIKMHGVIQPIVVQASLKGVDRLEVIAGHGRRDAAISVSLPNVPYIFRDVDEETAWQMHLAENEEREDVGFTALSKSIKRYMTEFKGDIEAIASKLNKTPTKIREYIEINKCSDKTLTAIEDGLITPAHAIVLAPFPHVSQDKNLPTIIAEKWSVSKLRQRVGKAKLPLDRGVFDKADCESCEFNTVPQLGLFGSNDTKAECANPTCFQKKTTEHFHTAKADLSAKYGHILLLSESNSEDRNTVSTEVVGKAQYDTCQSCDDKITILSDAWGKAGALTEHQCVNKKCFKDCTANFANEIKAQAKTVAKTSTDSPEEQAKTAKANAVKTAVTAKSGKLPTVVTEHYKTILRKASADFYAKDNNFIASVITASVLSQSKYSENGGRDTFNDAIINALSMTVEQRQTITKKAISHLLTTTETDANHHRVTDTLIRCLKTDNEKAVPFITEFWQPSDENLSIYTKDFLVLLAKSAGADKAIDAKEKGAFAKLTKKSKPDLIKGIQGADVDWKSYAPNNFKTLIK